MHGFWFKKFITTHDRLALEMNRYLQEAHIPEWMTKGRTTNKPPNNYRPMTCLPMRWEILSVQIREEIYD